MLTRDQIEYIQLFCKNKGIKYYDLRQELTDHIAKATEEILRNTPTSSLIEAVDIAYAKFGTTGFKNILYEKENSTLTFNFFKISRGYFVFPKILIPLSVFILLGLPLYFNQTDLFDILIVSAGLLLVLFAGVLDFFYFAVFKKPVKPLLIMRKVTSTVYISTAFLIAPFFVSSLYWNHFYSPAFAVGLVLFFTIFTTWGFALLTNCCAIYKKAKQDYPLAFKN